MITPSAPELGTSISAVTEWDLFLMLRTQFSDRRPMPAKSSWVFPLTSTGRPVLVKGNTQLLFAGMGRLSENCVLSIKNKSHSVTAEIEVPASGAEGVIIAQGANIGGWSLYAKGG